MTTQINYGLSNYDYHHSARYKDYLSSTDLKRYLVSPRAAKYAFDNPTEEKADTLRFGSLFHSFMEQLAKNEGDLARGRVMWLANLAVFEPPTNEKTGQPYGSATKAYKEAYDAFLAENEGKEIAEQSEVNTITEMVNSLRLKSGSTSKQVSKLLRKSKAAEVSYFYESEGGIKLKIRPDMLTNDSIVDWKTTSLEDLSEESIARAIIKYGYHISLSMYQYVLHEALGKWLKPILVFVQKQAPYDAIACDISEWCYSYDSEYEIFNMGVGALEFKRLLDLHIRCVKNGDWRGAETFIPKEDKAILKLNVPTWYEMKIINE